MPKFKIIGINAPGRINAKVDGRFTDINLFTASEEVLAKLYADKNPYVELTPEEFLERNPEAQRIEIRRINAVRKQSTKT